MNNYLITTLAYKKRARIIFAEMTELIQSVYNKESTSNSLAANFIELIATMCLMTGPIGSTEKMQIKITGDLPSKKMFGSLDGTGCVRGFVSDTFGKNIPLDIGNNSIFGKGGFVSVKRESGGFSGYTGITEARYKTISKNLENYYLKSEQLPTYFQLFISKDNPQVARGIMLQLLPGEPKSIISDFVSTLHKKKNLFINPLFVINMENLHNHFLIDLDYMATKPLKYQCACTKEMFYGVIFNLLPKEINEIIKDQQVLEAVCSMCGKRYLFTHEEIASLLGISLNTLPK